MMNTLKVLLGHINVMEAKLKHTGEPGYLHFCVFADYIRNAVQSEETTWKQLGIAGEAGLCQLEIECLVHAEENKYVFESWMRPALEAKLKKARGKALTAEEVSNIYELFPQEEGVRRVA